MNAKTVVCYSRNPDQEKIKSVNTTNQRNTIAIKKTRKVSFQDYTKVLNPST